MAPQPRPKLTILQWNCRGLKRKRETLQQYIDSYSHAPQIIALQEVNMEAKIRGYSTHQTNPSTCILVHKSCTATTVDLDLHSDIEYTFIKLLPQHRNSKGTYILNIYSRPKQRRAAFDAIFIKALREAHTAPLAIVGDFNASSPLWGYPKEDTKGRKLASAIADMALTLLTDPQHPTRVGTSITRDTSPDLTLVRNARNYEWLNTGETLGSDHYMLQTIFESNKHSKPRGQARMTDWEKFRKDTKLVTSEQITSYEEWAASILDLKENLTKTLATTEDHPAVDNHLLHLWEARRSLIKRWKKQRHNRKLRIRIAKLTTQADQYAWDLARTNWLKRCESLKGRLDSKTTWNLLRCLIDPPKSKSEQRRNLHRALHNFQGTDDELMDELTRRYICTSRDAEPSNPEYRGEPNEDLDKDFTLEEIIAALADMRRGTAPGQDKITVGLLTNLGTEALQQLTDYVNECWRIGTIPQAWKTAMYTLSPNPARKSALKTYAPYPSRRAQANSWKRQSTHVSPTI